MNKKKSYNGLLVIGVCSIITGLALLMYSISSYSEIKVATDKIDFDTLDNNNQIPISEKYYKYLSIWDTLNQKLEKNKNLPVKNMSCAYLDYAQHNVKSMYKLVYKTANEDTSKRNVVEGNIKTLLKTYEDYKTCRKTALYVEELNKILDEIENSNDIFYQGRLETFINGSSDIQRVNISSFDSEDALSEDYSQYLPAEAQVNNSASGNLYKNMQAGTSNDMAEQQYQKVQQYVEPNNKSKDADKIYYGDVQTINLNYKPENN